jgi:hypothetical protein
MAASLMASFVAVFAKTVNPPTSKSIINSSRAVKAVFLSRENVLDLLQAIRRKRKGRVKHEDLCQAEAEVFGPAEAGYQVQFLTDWYQEDSRARRAGFTVPNRLLVFGKRGGNVRNSGVGRVLGC